MNENRDEFIKNILSKLDAIEENIKELRTELNGIFPTQPPEVIEDKSELGSIIDYKTHLLERLSLLDCNITNEQFRVLNTKALDCKYLFSVDFGDRVYYFIRNVSPIDYKNNIIEILEKNDGLDYLSVSYIQHLFKEILLTENVLNALKSKGVLLDLCSHSRLSEIAEYIIEKDLEYDLFNERFLNKKIERVEIFNTHYNVVYGVRK